jgi:hypothetical protein
MRLIKLTSVNDKTPIHINIEHIGHMYEQPDKVMYGRVEEPKHTVLGVTTHNNGGFRIMETVAEIIKLIDKSKGI